MSDNYHSVHAQIFSAGILVVLTKLTYDGVQVRYSVSQGCPKQLIVSYMMLIIVCEFYLNYD